MKKVQYHQRHHRGMPGVVLSLLGCLLLAGCQNTDWTSSNSVVTPPPANVTPEPVQEPAPVQAEAPSSSDRGLIGLCQSELASLQRISPKTYAAKKASFDNLISSASVYTAVRGDINSQTKDTMDALYKYKTNQMCSEIERAVMDGLIRRGESVK